MYHSLHHSPRLSLAFWLCFCTRQVLHHHFVSYHPPTQVVPKTGPADLEDIISNNPRSTQSTTRHPQSTLRRPLTIPPSLRCFLLTQVHTPPETVTIITPNVFTTFARSRRIAADKRDEYKALSDTSKSLPLSFISLRSRRSSAASKPCLRPSPTCSRQSSPFLVPDASLPIFPTQRSSDITKSLPRDARMLRILPPSSWPVPTPWNSPPEVSVRCRDVFVNQEISSATGPTVTTESRLPPMLRPHLSSSSHFYLGSPPRIPSSPAGYILISASISPSEANSLFTIYLRCDRSLRTPSTIRGPSSRWLLLHTCNPGDRSCRFANTLGRKHESTIAPFAASPLLPRYDSQVCCSSQGCPRFP